MIIVLKNNAAQLAQGLRAIEIAFIASIYDSQANSNTPPLIKWSDSSPALGLLASQSAPLQMIFK